MKRNTLHMALISLMTLVVILVGCNFHVADIQVDNNTATITQTPTITKTQSNYTQTASLTATLAE